MWTPALMFHFKNADDKWDGGRKQGGTEMQLNSNVTRISNHALLIGKPHWSAHLGTHNQVHQHSVWTPAHLPSQLASQPRRWPLSLPGTQSCNQFIHKIGGYGWSMHLSMTTTDQWSISVIIQQHVGAFDRTRLNKVPVSDNGRVWCSIVGWTFPRTALEHRVFLERQSGREAHDPPVFVLPSAALINPFQIWVFLHHRNNCNEKFLHNRKKDVKREAPAGLREKLTRWRRWSFARSLFVMSRVCIPAVSMRFLRAESSSSLCNPTLQTITCFNFPEWPTYSYKCIQVWIQVFAPWPPHSQHNHQCSWYDPRVRLNSHTCTRLVLVPHHVYTDIWTQWYWWAPPAPGSNDMTIVFHEFQIQRFVSLVVDQATFTPGLVQWEKGERLMSLLTISANFLKEPLSSGMKVTRTASLWAPTSASSVTMRRRSKFMLAPLVTATTASSFML